MIQAIDFNALLKYAGQVFNQRPLIITYTGLGPSRGMLHEQNDYKSCWVFIQL